MSASQLRAAADSEGINGIGGRGRPDVRFQALTVHDIDRPVEQAGDKLLDADILIDPDRRVRIDLDQDVGIAVRARVTTRA